MEQGVIEPLVSCPSVGEESDGMDLVTGRSEDALRVQGSGRLLPVHMHARWHGPRSKRSKDYTHLVSSFLGRAWRVISIFCRGAGEARSRSRGVPDCCCCSGTCTSSQSNSSSLLSPATETVMMAFGVAFGDTEDDKSSLI